MHQQQTALYSPPRPIAGEGEAMIPIAAKMVDKSGDVSCGKNRDDDEQVGGVAVVVVQTKENQHHHHQHPSKRKNNNNNNKKNKKNERSKNVTIIVSSCIAYCFISNCMITTNRYLMGTRYYNFQEKSVALFVQGTIAVIILELVKYCHLIPQYESFSWKLVQRYSPVTISFVAMTYSGTQATSDLPIHVTVAMKNITNIGIVLGEWFIFHERPSILVLCSLLVVLVGAIMITMTTSTGNVIDYLNNNNVNNNSEEKYKAGAGAGAEEIFNDVDNVNDGIMTFNLNNYLASSSSESRMMMVVDHDDIGAEAEEEEDSVFSTMNSGYCWMILNCICTCTYVLYMKYATTATTTTKANTFVLPTTSDNKNNNNNNNNNSKNSTSTLSSPSSPTCDHCNNSNNSNSSSSNTNSPYMLSTFGMAFYNNLISIVLVTPIMICNGEIFTVWYNPLLLDMRFILLLFCSGIFGIGLNLASYYFVSVTSASTYATVGAMNKLFTTFIGVIILNEELDQHTAQYVIFAMIGGILYGIAKIIPYNKNNNNNKNSAAAATTTKRTRPNNNSNNRTCCCLLMGQQQISS